MAIVNSQTHSIQKPTRTVLFLRNFIPWQIIRFVVINIRMTSMILKSHGHRIRPGEPGKEEFPELKKTA